MKTAMTYQNELDHEVYRDIAVQFDGLTVAVSAATIAGTAEKPNEDTFALACGQSALFAAVFDGTTSLRPIAALNGQTGASFASHYLKDHFRPADEAVHPGTLLTRLNTDLLQESHKLGGTLEDIHTLPASTATIIKISLNSVEFAHVADSFGIAFYTDGRSEVFTDNKNEKFDARMFALISKIAQEKHITPREARDDQRVKDALMKLCIVRTNNPDGSGSGLVNGDPHLARYIQTGKLALQGISSILLGSDGLLPPGWSAASEADRQKIRAVIEQTGFNGMFSIKHEVEDNDPDWQQVRYKHSDDATGLYIKLGLTPQRN